MQHIGQRSSWQAVTTGLLGGAIGVLALDLFQQQLSPLLMGDNNEAGGNGHATIGALDDIAVIGQHHRPQESSTAALGRIVYHLLENQEPDKETKEELSYAVHYGYGILQGGVYGLSRAERDDVDLTGGLLFGAGLWLFGDELAVPLLGLQDGPTASPPATHLNRLAAHFVYGATTAVATQLLRRIS